MLKFLHRIFLAAILLVALPALAQIDPPSRVGRVSYLDGEVGFRVDRRDEGGPATLNWPVSSGAILESGRHGRAEVWIGSTAYRLGGDSQVEFPLVDDRQVDAHLNGGSLVISVLDRDQTYDTQVTTPDGTVRFLTPGRYRLNVYAERSELVVQAGRATFDNGQRIVPVAAGQMAILTSDGREQLDAARGYDAFDQWVANRENASLAGPARRYVSPYMTGYQDLDAYGDWRNTSDYGTVWYPRTVADDWAPYRFGRWAWVAPWGWTWVDQAPWGFAPFHYGRWVMIAGRWGWVPGRLVSRPVYAPALVGWVGDPGWSVSFSFGTAPAVGWFPLAPREVYVPAYRYSPNYVRQINVTQVSNVTIIDRVVRGAPPAYAYHAMPQAVTIVPSSHVREGRLISSSELRRPDRQDLSRAPQARQAPSSQWLAPTPAALRPHDGLSRSGTPERGPYRSETMPRDNERPQFRQSPLDAGGNRPEIRRPMEGQAAPRQEMPNPGSGRSPLEQPRRQPETIFPDSRNGARPLDSAVPTQPMRPATPDANRDTASESRREFFRRQQDTRPGVGTNSPDMRREERALPLQAPQEREQRREMRDMPRPQEATPSPNPTRREMPAPEIRRDERPQPSLQMQEREQRREMPREVPRDMPRMERQVQPSAPVMPPPQREVPRPAPEVRMPSQQPPQPRAEPPRPQPAPQGGNEQHRHDDERGPR
ncbi:MAG: hypothetical protein KGP14_00465 [Betaproteobacteria bacterium]|nr:hypothetical protein [Betaproteobacteria bacterium]